MIASTANPLRTTIQYYVLGWQRGRLERGNDNLHDVNGKKFSCSKIRDPHVRNFNFDATI